MSRPNISLADELAVGEYGTEAATDTAAHTPPAGYVFFRIDVVTAATFSAISSDASGPQSGNSLSGVGAFPVLFSLYGKFTSFTLASGKVIAYFKPLQS